MADRNTEKLDFFLIFSVVLVAMAGVLTLYTQEANTADGLGRWYKQFTFVFVGLISMWFMSRINYQLIGSYALFIYIFSIVLLVLTLIPGIGYLPSGRGARSWLKLGPITLQASEFSKLATVILLGQYLVLKEKEMHKITYLSFHLSFVWCRCFLSFCSQTLEQQFHFYQCCLQCYTWVGPTFYTLGPYLPLVEFH